MIQLEVQSVVKRFGGLTALNSVSLSAEVGEIVGIVGPNGAGKSTLFDVIAGVYSPDQGTVRFEGQDISRLPPHLVNRRGLARTFQKLRPFGEMTVMQNVAVGALPRTASVRDALDEAARILQSVGLGEKVHSLASALSTGQRKRLELARALATRPKLLMLDEVTGGVDLRSIPPLLDLVRGLRDGGLTVLLIEHNMRVVTQLSDRVIAMHLGEKIAEGRPDDVMRDDRVVEAYLGTVHA